MIATPNKQNSKEVSSPDPATILSVKSFSQSSFLLPHRQIMHHPEAGLNPLADAAAYLFSMLGKIKQLKSYKLLNQLQRELLQEIDLFQETAKDLGYNAEYIAVCRYLLCATFDEIISSTSWGNQGQWDNYSLLQAYHQDLNHQKKFFTIMERTIKEPRLYIDMMEVMYLCLSVGYKGQYRSTEYSQYQLEQVTSNLYKHIRAFRGNISKTLSPTPLRMKVEKKPPSSSKSSPFFILCVTACVIMIIFISLGYLMDAISNEAYKDIFPRNLSVFNETPKK